VRGVIGKIVLAVLGAAAAAGLSLRATRRWSPSDTVTVVLVVIVAVVAVLSSVTTAIGDYRRQRRIAATQDAEQALTAALWAIVDLLEASGVPIDYRDLSLSVYRLHRRTGRRSSLRRVHMLRARNRPEASGIRWKPGLGVIGTCVQQGRLVAQDFAAISDLPDLRTEADWATLPDDVRLGLSWDQFSAARGKYGTIVAAPVYAPGKRGSVITGCIALDGPPDMEDELSATPVVNQMLEAANGVLQ
jgi:hypothetical protein